MHTTILASSFDFVGLDHLHKQVHWPLKNKTKETKNTRTGREFPTSLLVNNQVWGGEPSPPSFLGKINGQQSPRTCSSRHFWEMVWWHFSLLLPLVHLLEKPQKKRWGERKRMRKKGKEKGRTLYNIGFFVSFFFKKQNTTQGCRPSLKFKSSKF